MSAAPSTIVLPERAPVRARERRRSTIGKKSDSATVLLPQPWTPGACMAAAAPRCNVCVGLGTRKGRQGFAVCACVYRAVFRCCYERYRDYETREKYMSRVTLEYRAKGGHFIWGRKQEEYCADFELVARRALSEFEYAVFRLHFLLGGDWRVCTRKLGLDRGNFFHAVYRVEAKLGAAYAELQPYALYPPNDYLYVAHVGVGVGGSQPAPALRTLARLPGARA